MNESFGAERLRRWRLVLGAAAQGAMAGGPGSAGTDGAAGEAEADGLTGLGGLTGRDAAMDRALGAVYEAGRGQGNDRTAGLGGSAPAVTRWLGDIRTYFPTPVVRVLGLARAPTRAIA